VSFNAARHQRTRSWMPGALRQDFNATSLEARAARCKPATCNPEKTVDFGGGSPSPMILPLCVGIRRATNRGAEWQSHVRGSAEL
jgi:hypothetical protein